MDDFWFCVRLAILLVPDVIDEHGRAGFIHVAFSSTWGYFTSVFTTADLFSRLDLIPAPPEYESATNDQCYQTCNWQQSGSSSATECFYCKCGKIPGTINVIRGRWIIYPPNWVETCSDYKSVIFIGFETVLLSNNVSDITKGDHHNLTV